MHYIDYHCHSVFSNDGDNTVKELAEKAFTMGIKEIAITDHHDFNYPLPFRDYKRKDEMKKRREAILNASKEMAGKIIIRNGTELGEPWYAPKRADKFVNQNDFDFVLASLHGLNKGRDFWSIDPSGFTMYELMDAFFDEFIKIDRFINFDCISHLTYPLRKLTEFYGREVDFTRYYDQIKFIFKFIIENGKGIEVNTSGWRHGFNRPYPDYNILKMYLDCGGEILTVGSDAHNAEYIGYHIKEEYSNLKDLGFKYITAFEKRKPIMHRL